MNQSDLNRCIPFKPTLIFIERLNRTFLRRNGDDEIYDAILGDEQWLDLMKEAYLQSWIEFNSSFYYKSTIDTDDNYYHEIIIIKDGSHINDKPWHQVTLFRFHNLIEVINFITIDNKALSNLLSLFEYHVENPNQRDHNDLAYKLIDNYLNR